ncbi:hypothetical protein BGZ99_007760 [Dissophora globulifera]|uniref:Uncharacterized protein n=1 Tax=Dissophora globulifera TaxID=979702 RepID=A0A9P6RB74_9FUNG|nr:hypothetical protein BGZ99_007760 [Dissophora globulifera]
MTIPTPSSVYDTIAQSKSQIARLEAEKAYVEAEILTPIFMQGNDLDDELVPNIDLVELSQRIKPLDETEKRLIAGMGNGERDQIAQAAAYLTSGREILISDIKKMLAELYEIEETLRPVAGGARPLTPPCQ